MNWRSRGGEGGLAVGTVFTYCISPLHPSREDKLRSYFCQMTLSQSNTGASLDPHRQRMPWTHPDTTPLWLLLSQNMGFKHGGCRGHDWQERRVWADRPRHSDGVAWPTFQSCAEADAEDNTGIVDNTAQRSPSNVLG